MSRRMDVSPAIALVRQLLVTLLAIVLAGTGGVEQVLPSDEVHPGTHLQPGNVMLCTG